MSYKIGILIPSTTKGLKCKSYVDAYFYKIFLRSFIKTYDKDFLSTQTVYGDDYGKEVETPKESPKAKDESGGDFLRHN